MRIVIIGQQAFGKAVLDAVLDAGKDEVVGVFCSPDRGGREDPIKEGAQERGVPVFQPGRFRSQEAIQQFRSLSPDLCVMAFVIDIVPPEMLNAPKLGTIQYHPSLLPKHRGPASINWAVIKGEEKTGLTIFWPDEGLDTGPVLLQKEVPIGPDDTVGSLYFDHLSPLGVESMVEAIDLVREGRAPKITQDEREATYESWVTDEDARIDWSKPVSQVYNLIRGCDPRPGAHTSLNGTRIRLFNCSRNDTETGADPGTVVHVDDDGFTVAASGGTVFVRRVQPPESRKVPAGEFATSHGLRAGDRLT
ncbi:MAG: methionyl-tRNA formyltransferase [Chloroflexota bacterium]